MSKFKVGDFLKSTLFPNDRLSRKVVSVDLNRKIIGVEYGEMGIITHFPLDVSIFTVDKTETFKQQLGDILENG